MGGVMDDGEREAAYKRLRKLAENLVARNRHGTKTRRADLVAAWKAFPELAADKCPAAADVVVMLAEADITREKRANANEETARGGDHSQREQFNPPLPRGNPATSASARRSRNGNRTIARNPLWKGSI